jgi:hypothetical protein
MKKFIALSVVLVVLAGGAGFAEVDVTGQFDAVVMPLQVYVPDKGDTQVGAAVGRNNASAGPRARVGVAAGTEQVGINFKVQFYPTTKTLDFDDFAEVWWQPVSPLKIEAGKFVNDTLRGKIGDDNWNNYTVKMRDADGIFSRFKSSWTGTVGFMLGVTPIEPLFIGVSVPGVDQLGGAATLGSNPDHIAWYTNEDEDAVGNAVATYEKIQAGLGYTIPNIGLVRAQYVGYTTFYDTGKEPSWTNALNAPRIEAAFAFTGVSGLVIDVGGKVPLPVKTYYEKTAVTGSNPTTYYYAEKSDYTYQAPYQVSLGAGFTADALDIKGRVDALVGGSKKGDDWENTPGLDVNVHLWPSYNLGFATAGLDLGFNYIGETEQKASGVTTTPNKGGYLFGAGLWLKKSYGSSSIKGGLAFSTGEVNENKFTTFSVPIIFDYTF